jgi:hypothetical protein
MGSPAGVPKFAALGNAGIFALDGDDAKGIADSAFPEDGVPLDGNKSPEPLADAPELAPDKPGMGGAPTLACGSDTPGTLADGGTGNPDAGNPDCAVGVALANGDTAAGAALGAIPGIEDAALAGLLGTGGIPGAEGTPGFTKAPGTEATADPEDALGFAATPGKTALVLCTLGSSTVGPAGQF